MTEMETSKEFRTALAKATEKRICAMLKPLVIECGVARKKVDEYKWGACELLGIIQARIREDSDNLKKARAHYRRHQKQIKEMKQVDVKDLLSVIKEKLDGGEV